MNKLLICILSTLILLHGCSSDKNIKDEVIENINVTIEQDGSTIEITDETAEIRRSKFSIKFRFNRPESILINASFMSETFNNAKEGLPLSELSGFKNTVISENLFNRDSVIYLSYDSPNFWYYTDDSDHRFSSISKNENGYICSRDISGIIDLDDTGERIELGKVRKNEIFLVIIKSEWNEDYTKMIEKSRKMIKLKFII